MSRAPEKPIELDRSALDSSVVSQPLCQQRIAKLTQAAADAIESIEVLASVGSTNSYLMEIPTAVGKARVCLAEAQKSGRGRRGNKWQSAPNKNIMFSLSWRFSDWPQTLTGLGLAVALVIAERLNRDHELSIGIKWPNDLLIKDEKLGGVLVDVSGNVNEACKVVIGLGLNVHQPDWSKNSSLDQESILKQSHEYAWTDLYSQGVMVDRNELAASLIDELLAMLKEFEHTGFGQFAQRWNSLACHANQLVVVGDANAENCIKGQQVGVNELGALLIKSENGQQRIVSDSNLSLRRAN